MRVCVTGGAGYIGSILVTDLLNADHDVIVLDALLHGQETVARRLEAAGARLIRGDIRDETQLRCAVKSAGAVVHLAAIVGDPACARDHELAHEVNVEGTRCVQRLATEARVEQLVFASTCSNYGRMSDPTTPIDEEGALAPVSLYAEQKVAMERQLINASSGPKATCVRFATVYGISDRMRFDLTVNEFTRDLWAARDLEVFGEQFWRPYIHVRDAARAVCAVLDAPLEDVAHRVFNAGVSSENWRKRDLVDMIVHYLGRGTARYVHRAEDPRDYKVNFERIRKELGFTPSMTVWRGIAEIVGALESGRWVDPYAAVYSN
ncbi:MAG TPA: NAD(P)-dependent oxidoreductase [Solirubrobacteraceae bacterium]